MIEYNLPENFRKRFEREVVYVMKTKKIFGMSIKITQNRKTIYERNFGSREREGQKPVNSDTLFGIASMTKSLTCLAILLLQEQTKLNINDPITKYVPISLGLKDHPITIRHLMCHASGIPDLGTYGIPINNEELNSLKLPYIPMNNWDDFYFHINDATDEIISEPGKKFYYSNDGFTILGQIVEKASGQKYEEFVKKEILEKLQMKRSTFSRTELEQMDNVSKGYDDNYDGKVLKRKAKPATSGPFNSGAGGLNSSVNDLTSYLQMQLNKGIFNGTRIISEELIQEMQKPHNKNSKSNDYLFGFKDEGYGYGLTVIENFFGKKLIYHSGSSGTSGGVYCFIPELDITYAHLQNVDSPTRYLSVLAMTLLLGLDPDEQLPYFKKRKHYAELVGKYKSYKNLTEVEIFFKNGLLYLREKGDEETFPLIPQSFEADTMDFYIPQENGRLDISFYTHNKEILFDYERSLMHKTDFQKEDYS